MDEGMVKLFTWINCVDQQKAAWFESDSCMSCASYIATILTVSAGP